MKLPEGVGGAPLGQGAVRGTAMVRGRALNTSKTRLVYLVARPAPCDMRPKGGRTLYSGD